MDEAYRTHACADRFGRLRCKWGDNIKMVRKETGVRRTLVRVSDPGALGAGHSYVELAGVKEAKELSVLRSSAVAWDAHMG